MGDRKKCPCGTCNRDEDCTKPCAVFEVWFEVAWETAREKLMAALKMV